jgi:hypothetical protein
MLEQLINIVMVLKPIVQMLTVMVVQLVQNRLIGMVEILIVIVLVMQLVLGVMEMVILVMVVL